MNGTIFLGRIPYRSETNMGEAKSCGDPEQDVHVGSYINEPVADGK